MGLAAAHLVSYEHIVWFSLGQSSVEFSSECVERNVDGVCNQSRKSLGVSPCFWFPQMQSFTCRTMHITVQKEEVVLNFPPSFNIAFTLHRNENTFEPYLFFRIGLQ